MRDVERLLTSASAAITAVDPRAPELEACALASGARVARIETSAVLTDALALYRSTG